MQPLYRTLLPIVLGCTLAACGGGGDAAAPQEAPLPAAIAMGHIEYLAGTIGQRPAGSAAEAAALDYIQGEFARLGLTTTLQTFDVAALTPLHSANVIAVAPGASPQQIIVGAHYDSVEIGAGASDNASGVGLLLACAAALAKADLPYTLRFIAFGAEEPGLLGSQYYVSQMSQEELARTVGMVNLDTVAGGDKLYVYGGPGAQGWLREAALAIARQDGIGLETNPGLNPEYPAGTTGDWSDHAPFQAAGIPYLYLEATNWEIGDLDGYTQTLEYGAIWHTGNDTLAFFAAAYPGRFETQLTAFSRVLTQLLQSIEVPETTRYSASAPMATRTAAPPHYTRRDGAPFQ